MSEPATSPVGQLLPITHLHPNPWSKRRKSAATVREDAELAASVRELGILENLLVRPLPEDAAKELKVKDPAGHYQVVAGKRRLQAALDAGLDLVPCTVRDLDDHRARVITISENLHRLDIHWLDEAQGVVYDHLNAPGTRNPDWHADLFAAASSPATPS